MAKATQSPKGTKKVEAKKSNAPRKITIRSQKEVAKPSVVTVSFRREIEITKAKGHKSDLKKSLSAAFDRYLEAKLP